MPDPSYWGSSAPGPTSVRRGPRVKCAPPAGPRAPDQEAPRGGPGSSWLGSIPHAIGPGEAEQTGPDTAIVRRQLTVRTQLRRRGRPAPRVAGRRRTE
ncbi:MAG TPA: hypothetical protein VFW21_01410 [Mycobacterium sp.]|nr:hypothetical protein [Mycobacterium sp.]